MLNQRLAEVLDRGQAGHWQGDLIIGPGNRTAIGTLVQRRTRFVILLTFPDAVATLQAVLDAITASLTRLPAALGRTLT